ncbi:hypothetical protein [Clostridium baratii]|uniref:hypothetical protein n=1 Tax=Clostridium baratii TaxID=1561 RepID=UPI00097FBC2F|nr:hypothetical protein [Clostridium baratii]AQM58544.1 hypothetical protein NPD11_3076 [Clostridium baratii]
MLGFLAGGSSNIGSDMGIPPVSTEQLNGKLNGIFGEFDKLMNGSFYNLVIIALAICVVALVISIIFHRKFAAKIALGIVVILVAVILFGARYELTGWFKTLSSM